MMETNAEDLYYLMTDEECPDVFISNREIQEIAEYLFKRGVRLEKHGHWIRMRDDDPDDFRCSNCRAIAPIDEEAVLRTGKIHRFPSPRCMWCGAIMMNKEVEL